MERGAVPVMRWNQNAPPDGQGANGIYIADFTAAVKLIVSPARAPRAMKSAEAERIRDSGSTVRETEHAPHVANAAAPRRAAHAAAATGLR
jgi:hypothetical protein